MWTRSVTGKLQAVKWSNFSVQKYGKRVSQRKGCDVEQTVNIRSNRSNRVVVMSVWCWHYSWSRVLRGDSVERTSWHAHLGRLCRFSLVYISDMSVGVCRRLTMYCDWLAPVSVHQVLVSRLVVRRQNDDLVSWCPPLSTHQKQQLHR